MGDTAGVKLLHPEERRWFVAAVVLVLVGMALLLLPFETVPGLGDARFVGRIIGAIGLGIIIRTVVLAYSARKRMRRRERGDA
jgi:hypothetical protein